MARQTQNTPKAAAQPSTLNAKIEQYKESLFQSAQNTTPFLTGCYINYFDSQISDTDFRRDHSIKPETLKKTEITRQAWQRAKQLFSTIAPVVLHELTQDIAQQIEHEFENVDVITASDVSSELNNLDLFELMEHIN